MMMGRRGHFHWNFFPGYFWGWRTGFPPMAGPWRWRPRKGEELDWLKEYLEDLKEMKSDLEAEIEEVEQRIKELEKEQ